MASISLRNVHKAYQGNSPVVRRVDLDIDAHEFCVFLGPSGCGKSTLLRMIAGLEGITSGELSIDGKVVNDVHPSKRNVAMVFQNYALYPHMSVYENMAFALRQAKLDGAVIDRKVRQAAAALQLDQLLSRKPAALSGGQRQRVAIGRAIVREPGVFLFDEPLSNLDAALRVQTRTEISRLHREFNQASAVYVTHDQTEAMALADKIVLLHAGADMEREGSIAQVGSPLDLYHRPKNRFVAGFIGSPRMNFVRGNVVEAHADGVHLRLPGGEMLAAAVDGRSIRAGAEATLGIRPEHLALAGGETKVQIIRAQARLIERFGECTYLHAGLAEQADAHVVAKLSGDVNVERGRPVALWAPPHACHVFDSNGLALPRLAGTEHAQLAERSA
ncbi:ABC transporter ATP-binding protein [Trinickia diaoshuihuensis]|jgi:multiple sugar transport system ATP-binding protein|uniref:ABC transporter ATP-binding protein n=1 Tax=Trinickia diaoshuihuensis TaxID=2292265 RepID=UPI000E254B93|nr:sn-glycerol-3-phosphate ABC transporter ATP-binding protein UgpC [Trinickia diaoshuihuensis]